MSFNRILVTEQPKGYSFVFSLALGKPQKKSSSTSGRATKRGGGGKGQAIKEKKLFLKLFILLPFKNKNYFT